MKFFHISDTHLGANPEAGSAYSKQRKKELGEAFYRRVMSCEEEKVDLLLISGDMFHRQPLLSELKEIDYFFSKLTRTKVVFIAGNHDYLQKNSYYRSFVWSDNVYPLLSEEMDCIEIDEIETAIYGCSYHQREVFQNKLEIPVELADQKYHILIGHGGDVSHMPFQRHTMKRLPYDYIALGHIHQPQILIENKMAYAGSLEPVNVVDYGEHGYISGSMNRVIETTEYTKVEIEFVPCAERMYRKERVEIVPGMTQFHLKEQILKLRESIGMQHMYDIELYGRKDPEVIFRLDDLDDFGNVLVVTDHSKVNYSLEELQSRNSNNLLGAYIRSFGIVKEGSVASMALYEGIQSIEETKKS